MNPLKVSYSTLKASASGLKVAYVQGTGSYSAYCMGEDFFCACEIVIAEDVADFEATLKPAALAAITEDDAYLLCRLALRPKVQTRTTGGSVVVATDKPDDAKRTFITHDWTDKRTWYTGSIFVDWAAATDSGDHLTYATGQTFLIDTFHGLLTDEDMLKDSEGRSYRVAVRVNGTEKAEQDPHYGSGGDFTVDYNSGTITFLSALAAEDVVEVRFHYAASSVFVVKPNAGKCLSLSFIECQFSADVEPKDSARFQAYGYVQSFAPQYLVSNGGPYEVNTLIPIGAAAIYKGIKDFMNGSVKSYPTYPAMGGSGWRGMDQPIYIFDWEYIAKTVLHSSMGMEIRITLDHDTVWGGEFATASFHCTQQ